jgi:hypothetical protein
MNSSNAEAFLPFVQALAEKKTIRFQIQPGCWADVTGEILFNGNPSDYLIKMDTDPVWLIFDQGGDRVRSSSHYLTEQAAKFVCGPKDRIVKYIAAPAPAPAAVPAIATPPADHTVWVVYTAFGRRSPLYISEAEAQANSQPGDRIVKYIAVEHLNHIPRD